MILMNPFPLGVSMRKSVPLLRKIASENRVVAISVDGEGKNPVIAEKTASSMKMKMCLIAKELLALNI